MSVLCDTRFPIEAKFRSNAPISHGRVYFSRAQKEDECN
jgi:hypothetical protein